MSDARIHLETKRTSVGSLYVLYGSRSKIAEFAILNDGRRIDAKEFMILTIELEDIPALVRRDSLYDAIKARHAITVRSGEFRVPLRVRMT